MKRKYSEHSTQRRTGKQMKSLRDMEDTRRSNIGLIIVLEGDNGETNRGDI